MLAASYDDAGSVTFFIQKLAFRKVSHTDSHVTSRSKYQLRYHMRVMKNTLFTSLPLVHFLCRNSTHDNANPDKRPPPWQSRTPGLAAWLCYQQPPAPGYLIAMGCLTRHAKDFIQRLKRATKIIHLIKASILYYSLNPPNSTAPRTIEYCSPCIPRRSHFLFYPYPVASTSDMVGCCVLEC